MCVWYVAVAVAAGYLGWGGREVLEILRGRQSCEAPGPG